VKIDSGRTSRELEGGGLSRRDFLAGVGIAMAGASALPAAAAEALLQPKPGAPGLPLFNGKDLSGFYTHLTGYGKNNDSKRVFRVDDGVLHITGEVNGGIISEQEYENYRLVAEYKWGAKMWPPRETHAMDCGLLLHCGNEDAVAVGLWPQSIQFQIYQGAVGDLVLLPGKDVLTATVEGEERGGAFHHVPGAPAQVRQAGGKKRFEIVAHDGKDPDWKNVRGFRGRNTAERPHDEWNTLEAIADGDTLTYIVNGQTVNRATKLSLTKGRIGIQSESGEVFFRRLELFPSR
jgi:hypothetical protein